MSSELTDIADQIAMLRRDGVNVAVDIEMGPEDSQAILRMADLAERQAVALERLCVLMEEANLYRAESVPVATPRKPNWDLYALAAAIVIWGLLNFIGGIIGG